MHIKVVYSYRPGSMPDNTQGCVEVWAMGVAWHSWTFPETRRAKVYPRTRVPAGIHGIHESSLSDSFGTLML